MFMYAISSFGGGNSGAPAYSGRNVDELLALARYYKSQGTTNTALEYYDSALKYLSMYDKPVVEAGILRERKAVEDTAAASSGSQ